MPIEQTIAIADELGIEHPSDPITGENIVMTTDEISFMGYKFKYDINPFK
ncbi:hypothetical protein [Acetivibrio cellulolyticus]|nr:hypothetical protein [Acetivibrio cellulolyticus]